MLATVSTGVMSFSTDPGEPPHSIPVSFGYDPVESVFSFRLAAGDDRAKGELENREVSFVVHNAPGTRVVLAGDNPSESEPTV